MEELIEAIRVELQAIQAIAERYIALAQQELEAEASEPRCAR